MANPFGTEPMNYGTVTGQSFGFRNDADFNSLKDSAANTVMEIQQNSKKLNRDMNKLGSPVDTDELRERVHICITNTLGKVQTARSKLIQLVHLAKSSHEKGKELAVKMLQQSMSSAINEFQNTSNDIVRAMEDVRKPSLPGTPLSASVTTSDIVDIREYDDTARMLKGQRQEQVFMVSDDLTHALTRAERMEQVQVDIMALNEVMLDIGNLVTEQGEIIDHIEGNVEGACVDVTYGNTQLEKGVKLKKCSRKLTCIVISFLAVIFLILIIIIIAVALHYSGGSKKKGG